MHHFFGPTQDEAERQAMVFGTGVRRQEAMRERREHIDRDNRFVGVPAKNAVAASRSPDKYLAKGETITTKALVGPGD
jgi:integrase